MPITAISVIVTVRDDREALEPLLEALAAQRRPPDELVVTDGGSTDGTLDLLHGWSGPCPVRVIEAPATNISEGRNIAIRSAEHEWLACTDAGCRPAEGWLAAIESAAEHADFVAGVYVVEGTTDFERALALALYPSPDELGTVDRLTSLSHRLFGRGYAVSHATGRSMAFTKAAWRAVGGFPEEVYAGEDVAFSSEIVARGFRAVLEPGAAVSWRPRVSWAANARMYRLYGLGDAEMGRARRHLARASAWVAAATCATAGGRAPRALALLGVGAYLFLPFRRAARTGYPLGGWWRIPAVSAMKDLALVAGALQGWRRRLSAAGGGSRRA